MRLRHPGHSTRRSSGSCLAFPTPVPGLVVRYSYLWASEHARGQEEGAKDRPCAVVLVVTDDAGEPAVTVLRITHQRPLGSKLGVEIPHATKRRLGLDDARSWVVLSEANRFIWPGPELRPTIPGNAGSVAYGLLPCALFEEIRLRLIQAVRSRLMRNVKRTE